MSGAGARIGTDGVVLEVRDLCTWFDSAEGPPARAVDGVDLVLRRGESVGLVGESGCGKSVTALSLLRLLPSPPARHPRGRVLFHGRDLLRAGPRELCAARGEGIAMVFQEPRTALNPVLRVGEQVAEVLRVRRGLDRRRARARALELFAEVGLPDPHERLDAWPHQLSGGQCQRVVLAIALALDPEVLVADEPTTALDVTVQAQILERLDRLRHGRGMALFLITHDLAVVAESAERVLVMYAGRIVEEADVVALFERPRHPYTLALLRSLPRLARPGEPLAAIEGHVPSPLDPPPGCRFHPRCPLARERCRSEEPALRAFPAPGAGRVACHFAEEVPAP